MGVNGQSNAGCPELFVHPSIGKRYALSWGCEGNGGPGYVHYACLPGERITAAQWVSITAAAVQGVAQMEAAIKATPAAPAYARAKAAALAGGVLMMPAQTRARYAAWHGAPLSSVWVTG